MSYSDFFFSLGLSSNSQPTETLAESSKSCPGFTSEKLLLSLSVSYKHTHTYTHKAVNLHGKHADLLYR